MVPIAKQNAVGRVFAGRYRVEGVLGRGAMGSVYSAVDQETNRLCAIKLMHQFATLDERAYLRFIHEAQIVAQLYHPNIVEVYGFDRDEDGTPILAMELLKGQDLHTQISEQSRLPLARVLEVVRAVGGALHAAHSAGVLHRDIKPKNIFLSLQKNSRGDEIETVKVVDFGLSKVLGMHHANETAPGTILGTAEYVAPESTLGMPELIDFRCDQWALGVVAYRLLTGRLPFEAPDVISLLLTIRTARPPSLRELCRSLPEKVPEHVLAAVERAMSKSKEDRFETVQDFLRALDGLPPVGHVLSQSSAGVPAINPADWSRRNLAGQSLTDLGRISISGAMQAPSASSNRGGNSSPSGKLAASVVNNASAASQRQGDSFAAGRASPKATALGLGPVPSSDVSSHTEVGAGQAPSRRTPKYGLLNSNAAPVAEPAPPPPPALAPVSKEAEAAGAFVPLPKEASKPAPSAVAGKPVEGSAEYSMHMSGHLVSGSSVQPSPDVSRVEKRRPSTKTLVPWIAVAVLGIGLIYVSTSRRGPEPPPATPTPKVAPTVAPPAETAIERQVAPPVAPPPVAPPAVSPTVASPTGVTPPVTAPAVENTPPIEAPVAVSPPPVAGPARPGVAPRPQPGATPWNKGFRPGMAYRPPMGKPMPQPWRKPGTPATPGAGPGEKPAAPAGVDTKPEGVAKNPPPVAAPPTPPPPPKEGEPVKRITVVD